MPQPGLIRKIVSLIPFCARSRSLINKLTTSQSSAVRGSQYSARYTSTDKMLQEEEFVGEGTSARTSLDVVSYGSKKRLQSKCAPVVKPRGAVGRKHRILHGGVALLTASLPPALRWSELVRQPSSPALCIVDCLSSEISKTLTSLGRSYRTPFHIFFFSKKNTENRTKKNIRKIWKHFQTSKIQQRIKYCETLRIPNFLGKK